MFSLIYIFVFNLICVYGKNEIYKGYQVYNVALETQEQQDKLYGLNSDVLDFWQRPCFKYNRTGRAMVPSSHVAWFEDKLQELNIKKDIYIKDVYNYLQEKEMSTKHLKQEGQSGKVFDFNDYYRYSEILDYMKSLENNNIGSSNINVTYVEAGVTDERRPLAYLEITSVDNLKDKPVAIIEAGILPREWITIPVALNIAKELLEKQNELLRNVKWIIVPVLNPDGYEYTHTNLRLWSKSRSIRSHVGVICPGVNINRNFDIDWMFSDSSSSPCSHLYGGIAPFSEPESSLIKSLIEDNKHRIKLYISLQDGGAYLAYPWQYEQAASGMFRQHYTLGREMRKVLGDEYIVDVGSLASGMRISGTSSDYAMKNDVTYTFNININGQSDDGILIPQGNIRTVADKVWRAVSLAARAAFNY